MPPLEQNLQSGEWLIFSGRTHWIRYLVPAVPALTGGLLWRSHHPFAAAGAWGLAAAIAFPFAMESLQSRFIVTNRRVILRRGSVKSTTEAIPLEDISAINVSVDLVGGWLKAGRVSVETSDGRRRALPWMGKARTFRRLALEQQRAAREAGRGRGVALPTPGSDASSESRLEPAPRLRSQTR